jgi:hypothetical protein
MDSIDPAALRGWTPVRVRAAGSEPSADWAVVDRPFTEPFFEHTADSAMQHPFNQVFLRSTPLTAFHSLGDELRDGMVAGLVFHMSRCGSTLIAQMLSRLSAALVVSEAQPVDGVLRLRRRVPGFDDAAFTRTLRGLVRAFGGDGERRIVLKFHAWHVLELEPIVQAFPGVPWAFLFREPRAVLRSQERQLGAEVLAGTIAPAYIGVRDAAELAAPDYGARVLAAFCESALRHAGRGRSAFVDYTSLPDAVFSRVLPHFGLAPSDDELQALRDAARRDSKDASASFARDAAGATAPSRAPAFARDAAGATAPSRAAAVSDDAIERQAARWLDAPYAALRALADVPA